MNKSDPLEAGGGQEIAIISANCRLPGSNSVEEFWNTLQTKNEDEQESIFKTPRENEGLENAVNFLKCPVDEFDAEFFNMKANKAVLLDPQQRLLLELTWEALENAAINPQDLKGTTTGVFVGAWSIDYEKVIANSSLAGSREFHVGYISSSYGALSSHISYFLGLNGKHATIDRGPSSSLFTLEKACKSLQRDECNLAIAAAVNLILFPRLGQTENKLSEGISSSISQKSAEGCCVVVLKRLADAITDEDSILGIIRSVGISTDATDGKFGEISQSSIEKAIGNAHSMATLEPKDISYVELQGKENIERVAIESVYRKNGNEKISFGCVAESIGNAESVAGFASLIKILLSLKHETIPSIPPTIWDKSTVKKRFAAINSYGFANECAHLILEESPDVPCLSSRKNGRNPYNILVLSANCANALEKLLENYKILLENTENEISDICFTANTCRAQLSHRVAMHGNSKDEILTLINNRKFFSGTSGKTKIAFLFNSHSKFRIGLLSKQFYQSNLGFKEAFDKCSEIFHQNGNGKVSLMDLLWDENIADEERQKYLLPINFSVQYSLTELLKSFRIYPNIVLGYNTGEFSAAVTAGILTLSDTLKFLMQISEEIYLHQNLTLISIASSKLITEKLLSFYIGENPGVDPSELKIFAVDSINQVVIGSNSLAIATEFVKLCLEETIEAKIISNSQSSINFSTILPKFFESLHMPISGSNNLNCKYVSGITGNILPSTSTDQNYWKEFSSSIVDFSEGFKTLWMQGYRIFIDVGSNADLIRLAKLNISQTQAASCIWASSVSSHQDNLSSLATLLSKLFVAGSNINWKTWYENSYRTKVQIPTYPFQRERFWPVNN